MRHRLPLRADIPTLRGLQELYCYDCPLITDIPLLKGLKKLNCYKSPI